MSYLSQTQNTTQASDLCKRDLSVQSREQDQEQLLVQTCVDIGRSLTNEFDGAINDIEKTINGHPFYVLYEPKLGCNNSADSSVAHSVFPVFKYDLTDILNCLELKVKTIIEPKIKELIAQREDVIVQTFKSKISLRNNAKEEIDSLQKQVEYLQAALIDNTNTHQARIDQLKKENQMLREQLDRKNKIGNMYQPDFLKGGQQEDNNHAAMMKQQNELLMQQKNAFDEERRKANIANQQIIEQLNKQIQELLILNEQYKNEIDALTRALKQKEDELTAYKQTCELKHQQELEDLQQQINDLIKQQKAITKRYEDELRQKIALIKELQNSLEKYQRVISDNEDLLKKLRDENAAKTLENQRLQLNNQDLLKLQEQNPKLASQVQDLQDQLNLMKDKYDYCQGQISDLIAAKKLLEEELERLKKEMQQNNANDTSYDQLFENMKKEFNDIKSLTSKTLLSLFNPKSGSLIRQAGQSLFGQTIYDLLKKEVGDYLWLFVNKYYQPEYEMILQYSNKYSNAPAIRARLPNASSEKADRQTDNNQLTEVNAVLLDNVQISSKRIPSAGKKGYVDVGVNTSLCGSLGNQQLDDSTYVNPDLDTSPENLSKYPNVTIQNGQNQHNSKHDGDSDARIRCRSCKEDQSIGSIEIYGVGDQSNGMIKATIECDHCGVGEGTVTCAHCNKESMVSELRISSTSRPQTAASKRSKSNQNVSLDGDDVEYLYRPESSLNKQTPVQQPNTQNDNDISILDTKDYSFTYICPHCKNSQNLKRANVRLSKDNDNACDAMASNVLVYNNNRYNVPYEKFTFVPKAVTKTQTFGVFDRLFQKAKEIEERKKRKIDLILQERQRTLERVLRSLSLFVDNQPLEQSQSSYQIQSGQRFVNMRNGRPEVTTPSQRSAHSVASVQSKTSYIQAIMAVNSVQSQVSPTRRPGSAVGLGRNTNAVRLETTYHRPQSGRQDSVMQLLKASNMLGSNGKQNK